jgi:hypothetical protein
MGMPGKRLRRIVLLLCALLPASLLVGCNELELKSAWRDRDILIDGDATDWRGLTTYVEKGNIAVGVANDRENLFVCLHSPTREVAGQIVLRGLTVWFDPEGGPDGRLGFHCPLGADEMPGTGDDSPAPGDDSTLPGEGTPRRAGMMSRPGGPMTDRDEMREMIIETVDQAAREVEVLGPENLVYGTFPIGDIQGLEISLGYADGRIVYELKLPLEKTEDRPYALGVNWDKKVGIRFVTPEFDMEAMREAMRVTMGDRPPGAMPAGGGMHRGAGVSGRMPEPVELTCRAELASPPEEGGPQDQ